MTTHLRLGPAQRGCLLTHYNYNPFINVVLKWTAEHWMIKNTCTSSSKHASRAWVNILDIRISYLNTLYYRVVALARLLVQPARQGDSGDTHNAAPSWAQSGASARLRTKGLPRNHTIQVRGDVRYLRRYHGRPGTAALCQPTGKTTEWNHNGISRYHRK